MSQYAIRAMQQPDKSSKDKPSKDRAAAAAASGASGKGRRWGRKASALAQAVESSVDWPAVRWCSLAIAALGLVVHAEWEFGTLITTGICMVAMVALLATVAKRPEVALYALVIYIPFSRVLPGDFGGALKALNLTNLLTLFILASWAAAQKRFRAKRQRGSMMGGLILIFCLWSAIVVIYGAMVRGGWYLAEYITSLKQWLTPMLFYYLARLMAKDRRVIGTVAALMVVAVTVVSGMAARDYELEGRGASSIEKARIGGICDQPNMLGAFLVNYGSLMGGFLLTFWGRRRAWLLTLPMALVFRGVQVTFSRGAYLALGLSGMTMLFFKNKILALLAGALAAFAVMNPHLLPGGLQERMESTVQQDVSAEYVDDPVETLEASARNRIYAWRAARLMISERPLMGMGYGTFSYYSPIYNPDLHGRQLDAHNQYLLLAAEMGLPTVTLFVLILLVALYEAHWVYRHQTDPFIRAVALGCLGGLMGLIASNMFGSRMIAQEVAGYFWVLAGIMSNLRVYQELPGKKVRAGQEPEASAGGKGGAG